METVREGTRREDWLSGTESRPSSWGRVPEGGGTRPLLCTLLRTGGGGPEASSWASLRRGRAPVMQALFLPFPRLRSPHLVHSSASCWQCTLCVPEGGNQGGKPDASRFPRREDKCSRVVLNTLSETDRLIMTPWKRWLSALSPSGEALALGQKIGDGRGMKRRP